MKSADFPGGPQGAYNFLLDRCTTFRREITPLRNRAIDLQDKGFRRSAIEQMELEKIDGRIRDAIDRTLSGVEIMQEPMGMQDDCMEDDIDDCIDDDSDDLPIERQVFAEMMASLLGGMPMMGMEVRGFSRQSRGYDVNTVADMELKDVETDGRTYCVSTANLVLTPWSREFAHGSDMLIPITKACSSLLAPDERLISLDRISWKKPVTSNLKLTVREGESPFSPDVSVDGRFRTSKGRVLSFGGVQIEDSPICETAPMNTFAEGTICECSDCCRKERDGTYRFNLTLPDVPECLVEFEKSVPLSATTLVEILTTALVRADFFNEIQDGRRGRQVLRLMGGVSDMPIPLDMAEVFKEGATLTLKFDRAGIKKGQSGMTLVPFQFQFPHQPKFGKGIAAVTCREEIAERCIRS
ncbi:MAG: hypothetical protein ACD_51C00051G0004 [uncultured bacterium]|nr:MAG: hypothetical protein ACD_51C00051G0004 [uncultured bacterium]OGJ46885.1 MAG: hypothetical protein A2244_03035 [Candidatus Peregrinibacteria bacterium RIFOXYA2_FULL_41_18]OGJ49291.1 MAG: hypothetical protein A2344_00075 [Candidatus Peregrinibacteria bacterium RIFOXYB12_FULL_41_12]OGJ53052.1 MAG: hypothetical protein A2448_01555 [Candidatus Peregrinibacteria bacterium RIFOXYC2_FULL_41_22]OGJ54808.1 MAG: hypothetical protein A2336_02155 [Candidatus Peregrinibacteria bacterium RIFOXYB2_FULL